MLSRLSDWLHAHPHLRAWTCVYLFLFLEAIILIITWGRSFDGIAFGLTLGSQVFLACFLDGLQ